MKNYYLGLYEKSMPNTLTLEEKLRQAKASGFDFMEISIDETDAKLSRLDMTREERKALVDAMYQAGLPIKTMCLSGHRKYPLGSRDESVRARGLEIMEKAIQLACDLGLRIIQLAGYDVYYEEGGEVIADRYTTSNAVHQCSKLPPEQWDDFLRWAFDYEYRLLGLPAPDAVVYLQVDPAVSQKLMTQRYHGDESRKDVHEKDTEYLARSRCAAEYCAAHLGWAVVHCTSGDNMRSIEDIQAEVQEIVLKQLT